MQTPAVHCKLRPQPERTPFRRGHSKRPYPQCPPKNVADGLAGHVFKPLLPADAACLVDWKRKERDFFNSLSFLADVYGFKPPAPGDNPYPVNIIGALEIATREVNKIRPNTALFILRDDSHVATIATKTYLSNGYHLYYIPLQPLYWMWENPEKRCKAELLASILAYFHQVQRVATFTNEHSFLYYYYDMMRTPESIDGREHAKQILEACHEAFKGGKKTSKIIRAKTHLRLLADRVHQFKPTDEDSTELHRLAVLAGELNRLYPKLSIHSSIPSYADLSDHEDIVEADPINSYELLTFCWVPDAARSHATINWLNSSLQQTPGADDLTDQQLFDKPQPCITRNLDFEERVFELINGLALYLNKPSCKR